MFPTEEDIMSKTVSAIFPNYKTAAQAMEALRRIGFSDDDFSILAAENSAKKEIKVEEHTKAPEGASIGAGIGGAIGAAMAGLTAVGTITATGGVGLLATGPVVAALAGAGAGGVAGGLLGGLIGLGLPETEAKFIDEKVGKGYVMLGVTVEDERKKAATEVLEQCYAEKVSIH
jgi:hypothetical protein